METKYTAIIDQIGRTIVGKVVGSTDNTLTLQNPVIIHVQPQPNGHMTVNTFPLFFFEFIDKAHRDKNEWTFNLESIVTSNVVLNADVIRSYEQLNTPPPIPSPMENNPKVISINDI